MISSAQLPISFQHRRHSCFVSSWRTRVVLSRFLHQSVFHRMFCKSRSNTTRSIGLKNWPFKNSKGRLLHCVLPECWTEIKAWHSELHVANKMKRLFLLVERFPRPDQNPWHGNKWFFSKSLIVVFRVKWKTFVYFNHEILHDWVKAKYSIEK